MTGIFGALDAGRATACGDATEPHQDRGLLSVHIGSGERRNRRGGSARSRSGFPGLPVCLAGPGAVIVAALRRDRSARAQSARRPALGSCRDDRRRVESDAERRRVPYRRRSASPLSTSGGGKRAASRAGTLPSPCNRAYRTSGWRSHALPRARAARVPRSQPDAPAGRLRPVARACSRWTRQAQPSPIIDSSVFRAGAASSPLGSETGADLRKIW
jgi:hypothetical protein